MLTLSDDKRVIRWSELDSMRMARIVGIDSAVQRSAPVNPAIIRAAQKRGLDLHPKVQRILSSEVELRRLVKTLKTLDDAPATSKVEALAFPHQRSGLAFMRDTNRFAYLVADQTGVGKTLLALMFAQSIARARSTLIVTKNAVKDQWRDAIHHFLGKKQRVVVVDGTVEEQIEQSSVRNAWVVCHWEALVHAEKGVRWLPWDCVIADEAHLAANRDSYRSMTLHRLGQHSTYRLALTAHPFTNNPAELFAILRFLYPAVYTSYWRFFWMYVRAEPREFGQIEITGARRAKLLQWEIAPFTLMRTKQQVFPNHPRIDLVRRTVSLTKKGLSEYDKLKRQFFVDLESSEGTKTIVIPDELPRLTRIRQYLIDPGLLGASEKSVKYPVILDTIDEVNEPVVVFSSFKQAVLRLGHYLTKAKKRVGFIYGRMSRAKQTATKRAFLEGRYDALLVVAEAGDTGLNLGRYGYVIHLDLPFTPRGMEQAWGRVDRPEENTGKLVPTTAYRVIVKDSYEERLEQRLVTKHETFREVFTVKDMKELFG